MNHTQEVESKIVDELMAVIEPNGDGVVLRCPVAVAPRPWRLVAPVRAPETFFGSPSPTNQRNRRLNSSRSMRCRVVPKARLRRDAHRIGTLQHNRPQQPLGRHARPAQARAMRVEVQGCRPSAAFTISWIARNKWSARPRDARSN